jgi:hypothetical protein
MTSRLVFGSALIYDGGFIPFFSQEQNESKFNVILHKANTTTYNFACRAKQDTYNVSDKSVVFASIFLTIQL